MSGQWEVVGKKKAKDSASLINNKKPTDNKKKMLATPKVEEVLPLQQVKNLYNLGKNKENRKPVEKKQKVQENDKKPQKKQEKNQEPQKPKPKSIESALTAINIDEFNLVYDNSKRVFPDAPLIWLKEVVQFLNQHVSIEVHDPSFHSKPKRYPYSIVPAALKTTMEKTIKDAGNSNAQLFFDMCLTAMATDMGKNMSVFGHKIYIQHLAFTDPQFVLTNLSKHLILRNSYQNRQNIGLSILWALGQAGLVDLNVGLRVFQEIMLPVIEMKNYARYIVQYLITLIDHHENVHITAEQYLLILDVAYANYKNFPNDLRPELQKIATKLENMLLSPSGKVKTHLLVEPLLKKMQSNNTGAYKDEISKTLVGCFNKDQTALTYWSKCYIKCLPQSAILLHYLDQNWKRVSNKFDEKELRGLFTTFSLSNEELLAKKRKENGLLDCVASIKRLTDKMAIKKKSGFPYKCYSFILVAIITGVVYYDIRLSGSWQRSRLYSGLKDIGMLKYTNKVTERSLEGLQWIHVRIDEQIPGYYDKSSEYLKPYIQLGKDLGLLCCNLFDNMKAVAVEKYPVVISSIESYAPGLIEESQKVVCTAWSTSVVYFNSGVDYLKTEVFVGQLAPENVQRVVLEAFNTTQQKASEYYLWIYEKVQSTIK